MQETLLNIALDGALQYPIIYEQVISTNIQHVTFIPTCEDGSLGVIAVRFAKSGQLYLYGDCTKAEFDSLFTSSDNSVGKEFVRKIKNSEKPYLGLNDISAQILTLVAHNTAMIQSGRKELVIVSRPDDTLEEKDEIFGINLGLDGTARIELLGMLGAEEVANPTEAQVDRAVAISLYDIILGEHA